MDKEKLTEKERIEDRIEMLEWEIRNNEEETAADQNEVAPRDFVSDDGEERGCQSHNPCQRKQQCDTAKESKGEQRSIWGESNMSGQW